MKKKKNIFSNITPPPPLNLRGGDQQGEGDINGQLREEIQVLDQNWKRALADYQNLVKRIDTDKREFIKFVTTQTISKFLPSLDLLEMAVNHNNDQGLNLAVKQFKDVLREEGLQEINPQIGDQFDHTIHECLEVLPGGDNDTIAQVLLKGYKIGESVIRPAKVKVFKI